MTRDEVLKRVSETFEEMFEVDPGTITLDARLVEDLDLDSIDAIDMAAKMQELTGKRLEEDELRRIHRVGDVVDVIVEALNPPSEQNA